MAGGGLLTLLWANREPAWGALLGRKLPSPGGEPPGKLEGRGLNDPARMSEAGSIEPSVYFDAHR